MLDATPAPVWCRIVTVALAIGTLFLMAATPRDQRYFVVNGPEYHAVTAAAFGRETCMQREHKSYAGGVVVHLCYI